MQTENLKVLVTGGGGYIGSHACKALKQAGFIPITFDNFTLGWKDAVKFGPYVQGDLRNKYEVQEAFTKYSPIAVMHFAGVSQVRESVLAPNLYWENNVLGSLNLIQSALDHDCSNFIFSSTCATYGNQDNVVLSETSVQNPNNPYGTSKQAVENILKDFESAYGMSHIIFRYFNVAGADPEGEIGELHLPETHLIPLLFDSISCNSNKFTLYGTDYDTPDGTCIRDYVHVCDLVEAHVLGLKWLLNGRPSRIFNLGTGRGFSVKEVISQVELTTNQKVPYLEGERRPGDCTSLVSGSIRANNELGWKARKSNLAEIVKDAWNWHQNVIFKR